MAEKYNKYFGFKSYNEYLNSEHWRNFVVLLFDARENKINDYINNKQIRLGTWNCEECHKKFYSPMGLQVHHKSYDCLGSERSEDVILVCKQCHKKIHGK